MIFQPRVADLDPLDLQNALLGAAVGDYAGEAAVLLVNRRCLGDAGRCER